MSTSSVAPERHVTTRYLSISLPLLFAGAFVAVLAGSVLAGLGVLLAFGPDYSLYGSLLGGLAILAMPLCVPRLRRL